MAFANISSDLEKNFKQNSRPVNLNDVLLYLINNDVSSSASWKFYDINPFQTSLKLTYSL